MCYCIGDLNFGITSVYISVFQTIEDGIDNSNGQLSKTEDVRLHGVSRKRCNGWREHASR